MPRRPDVYVSKNSGLELLLQVILTGGFLGYLDLGPVPTRTTVTLRMSWIPSAHRIDYQVNAEPVQSILYSLNDALPPSTPYRSLEVAGFLGNCVGGPTPSAEMTALFDNVWVNR